MLYVIFTVLFFVCNGFMVQKGVTASLAATSLSCLSVSNETHVSVNVLSLFA